MPSFDLSKKYPSIVNIVTIPLGFGFHAHPKGHPEVFEHGRTEDEAIDALIVTFDAHDRFIDRLEQRERDRQAGYLQSDPETVHHEQLNELWDLRRENERVGDPILRAERELQLIEQSQLLITQFHGQSQEETQPVEDPHTLRLRVEQSIRDNEISSHQTTEQTLNQIRQEVREENVQERDLETLRREAEYRIRTRSLRQQYGGTGANLEEAEEDQRRRMEEEPTPSTRGQELPLYQLSTSWGRDQAERRREERTNIEQQNTERRREYNRIPFPNFINNIENTEPSNLVTSIGNDESEHGSYMRRLEDIRIDQNMEPRIRNNALMDMLDRMYRDEDNNEPQERERSHEPRMRERDHEDLRRMREHRRRH